MYYRTRGHTGVQVSVLVLGIALFDRLECATQERSQPSSLLRPDAPREHNKQYMDTANR